MTANAPRMQSASEDLRYRFETLQSELEHAVAEEQARFAFCARCRELCHNTEAAFESSGDGSALQAWKEAESEWMRAREAHSDARMHKTTLKIQVETLRAQIKRLDSQAHA